MNWSFSSCRSPWISSNIGFEICSASTTLVNSIWVGPSLTSSKFISRVFALGCLFLKKVVQSFWCSGRWYSSWNLASRFFMSLASSRYVLPLMRTSGGSLTRCFLIPKRTSSNSLRFRLVIICSLFRLQLEKEGS